VASEGSRSLWRTVILAAWIFGCAAYYYVRFTNTFLHANESAIRQTFPQAAQVLLPAPGDR